MPDKEDQAIGDGRAGIPGLSKPKDVRGNNTYQIFLKTF